MNTRLHSIDDSNTPGPAPQEQHIAPTTTSVELPPPPSGGFQESSETSPAPGPFSGSSYKKLNDIANSKRFAGPLIRCAFIGVLTFLLLIPLDFVGDIVYERSYLHQQATENITASWGSAQSISGPVLVVPYQTWRDRKEVVVKLEKGKEKKEEVTHREYFTHFKVFLPTEVSFDAALDPEVRYRGIYRQTLYNAPVSIKGFFTMPTPEKFASNIHKVLWEHAWLAIGITDLKTISEESPVVWEGTTAPAYKPGTKVGTILGSGFHAAIPMTEKASGVQQKFEINLKIRGSGGISFTPVGEKTTMTIAGAWPAPSFRGNLLPVERSISDTGFSAKWNISNLTRTYPQVGELEGEEFKHGQSRNLGPIPEFTAGVDLHETVSLYRMVTRAVHYGILFISVSFVALFAFEMISRQRMHLLQYGMVGLSMSLFYLILISLAEHVDFALAFAVASAVTISMNSLYIASALQSKARGLTMGLLLTALYVLLFSLLLMEDFALLVGTGLVITMMGVLMFVTRKLPQSPS